MSIAGSSGIDAEWYCTPDIPGEIEKAITQLVGAEVWGELRAVINTFLDASHFEKQEPSPSEVRKSIEEIANLSADLIEKLRIGISETVDVELQEAMIVGHNLIWPEFRKYLLESLQKLETSAHHACRSYEERRTNFEVAERIKSKSDNTKNSPKKLKTKPHKLAQQAMAFEVAVCMKANGLPVTTSQNVGRADSKPSKGSKYVEVVALILSIDDPGDRMGTAHNLARAALKLKDIEKAVKEHIKQKSIR